MKPDYDKVGLLVVRDNRVLLCRKKHTTSLLILPGGCFEPGETAAECLRREVREELAAGGDGEKGGQAPRGDEQQREAGGGERGPGCVGHG